MAARSADRAGQRTHIVILLLRTWLAARELGEAQLPAIIQRTHDLSISSELGIAAASLFELAEHQLGRHLVAECCCSFALSTDEYAMLALLAHATDSDATDSDKAHGSPAIPHGLSAALCWAARFVVDALDEKIDVPMPVSPTGRRVCPFA